MTGPVLVDANLLLLLITGSADRRYIGMHKNLSGYEESDFDLLGQVISLFSDLVLLPHVLAEVSSLASQIRNPARRRIQEKLKELVETAAEIAIPNLDGVRRDEFHEFGLTDGVMLQLCSVARNGVSFSLLTADNRLAVHAEMLGYSVLNFLHLR
jgi:hypothetical protein